jgi:hypothetical protein
MLDNDNVLTFGRHVLIAVASNLLNSFKVISHNQSQWNIVVMAMNSKYSNMWHFFTRS